MRSRIKAARVCLADGQAQTQIRAWGVVKKPDVTADDPYGIASHAYGIASHE